LKKLRYFLARPSVKYGLISLLLAFILPYLSRTIGISHVVRIIWLFIVINMITAVTIGYLVARKRQPVWLILIFPVLFTLGVYVFYGHYAYWFAPIYLCLSYLSYGLRKPAPVAK
jgi:hypothetical protein